SGQGIDGVAAVRIHGFYGVVQRQPLDRLYAVERQEFYECVRGTGGRRRAASDELSLEFKPGILGLVQGRKVLVDGQFAAHGTGTSCARGPAPARTKVPRGSIPRAVRNAK